MSSYKDKVCSTVETLAKNLGLEIFDIEMPASEARGFLRVYITRPDAVTENNSDKKSVTAHISDCTRLSKQILNHPDVEELLPGDCQLEVSSPGINRKLSKGDHFSGAIGERVRLVVNKDVSSEGSSDKEVVRGLLVSFNGSQLEIEEEENKAKQVINYNSVAEARVDFKFDEARED